METQTRKKLVSHGVQTVLACSPQNISDYLMPIYYKCNVNKCHSQSKYWPSLRRQLVDDQTRNWWSIVVERLNLLEALYERPFEGGAHIHRESDKELVVNSGWEALLYDHISGHLREVAIYIGSYTTHWWSPGSTHSGTFVNFWVLSAPWSNQYCEHYKSYCESKCTW